ncbi:MAG TPA: hypothetical protein VM307_03615 [Egibacteraceae bacterium]|nr:hypothetical protein [Egibacteraceae bacterium]
MSVLYDLTLVCNQPHCRQQLRAGVVHDVPVGRRDVRAARRFAAGRGWTTPRVDGRRVDLCPPCSDDRAESQR